MKYCLSRHAELVSIFRVSLDLFQGLVAGDGGDLVG
jgi:hypothetical protein